MFSNPSFEGSIEHWTLQFKSPKVEKYYKRSLDEEYLSRFSMFYMSIGSMFITMCLGLALAWSYFSHGKRKEGLMIVIADTLIISGILLELLVNCVRKLRFLKSIPLVLFTFLACAIVNSGLEPSPVLRPGYVIFY